MCHLLQKTALAGEGPSAVPRWGRCTELATTGPTPLIHRKMKRQRCRSVLCPPKAHARAPTHPPTHTPAPTHTGTGKVLAVLSLTWPSPGPLPGSAQARAACILQGRLSPAAKTPSSATDTWGRRLGLLCSDMLTGKGSSCPIDPTSLCAISEQASQLSYRKNGSISVGVLVKGGSPSKSTPSLIRIEDTYSGILNSCV